MRVTKMDSLTFLPDMLKKSGFLFLCIIAVNYSILAANLIYPEQSYFYFINSKIQTLTDLFNVYLDPQMLNIYYVPFFRPSGHFLMYQLLMPFLDWHKPQELIIVNFIFLSFTGYLLLKMYQILFPRYKLGGYIAFSIYLIHPALILSRFIAMHFEYAYIFFLTASLYCFMLFCKQNTFLEKKLQDWNLFIYCLILFAIAVTFKEPAIMLGVVLLFYLCLHKRPKWNFNYLKVIGIICSTILFLGWYLTLQWPSIHHLAHKRDITEKGFILFQNFLGWFIHQPTKPLEFSWVMSEFSWPVQVLLTILFCVTVWNIIISKNKLAASIKLSILFLLFTSLSFLVLPLIWSMGHPWHLSPSILFFSLITGFSVEYLFLKNNNWKYLLSGTLVLLILIVGAKNTTDNIHRWQQLEPGLTLHRNALLHPPAIQKKLNANSLLIVEDSSIHKEYKLGNSTYPIFQLESFGYTAIEQLHQKSFMKYDSLYNGTLFRWAYQMPDLQEQVFDFHVEDLANVPSSMIYLWLQHIDNIFCVGYDKEANWHDKTEMFKKNLLKEQSARALIVNSYQKYPMAINGQPLYVKTLLIPIPELCQYECDINPECKATSYVNKMENQRPILQCEYFDMVDTLDPDRSSGYTSFIK